MKNIKFLIPLCTSVILTSCSGSSDDEVATPEPTLDTMKPGVDPDTMKPGPDPEPETTVPLLTLTFTATKTFHFTWVKVTGATSYKIKEDINSRGDYQDIKLTTATATSFDYVVPLYGRVNAKYVLQSCITADDCTASVAVFTSAKLAEMVSSIGYFKASNTGALDVFGSSVSLSDDGNTLAVGASGEGSTSNMINEGQDNDSASGTGAAYVFTRNNTSAGWSQQAYLKASNAGDDDRFGASVSLSEDGNTLVVGALGEGSSAKGTNASAADQAKNDALGAGAAYVFIRTGAGSDTRWSQQAYLKASNTDGGDHFGTSVSLSDDGNTLAVSSPSEKSNAIWSNSSDTPLDQNNDGLTRAGAVYVFIRTGAGTVTVMWQQQAYLKATNTQAYGLFGFSVSLNDDGTTLAVGAYGETGAQGAVFVFIRTVVGSDTTWSHQALLKATNKFGNDQFGNSVSISADGNTLAVGARYEDSAATGVSSESHTDDNSQGSGAAYVFIRTGAGSDITWSQQAYLKASNTDVLDFFGSSISISADGNTLAVGALNEDSGAAGINNEDDGNVIVFDGLLENNTGAVYTFTRSDTTWSPQAYIKANNTEKDDEFGTSVALSADGGTLAVGALKEDSNATDVNADKDNNDAGNAGAVYLY